MSDFKHGDQIQTAAELQAEWDNNPRWAGIKRDYTAEDVIKLRGPVREERTLAKRGADKLWDLIQKTMTPMSGSVPWEHSPVTRPFSKSELD